MLSMTGKMLSFSELTKEHSKSLAGSGLPWKEVSCY